MKRLLALLLACLMVCAAVPTMAMAEGAMTSVGTPRAETLIVDPLVGKVGNPFQTNPYMSGTTLDGGLHQLCYSHLWEIDTIKGEQFPALAAEMPTANEDYTQFTVKLREGIKWSDGEDFNADDVVFTLNMLLEHKDTLPFGASLATVVKAATKTGDYELTVDTVKTFPRLSQFLGVTVWGVGFYVMPEHIWKDVDPADFANPDPVVIGPYTLKDRDPQGNWTLFEKREDWQNTDVGILYGEPQAKYVLFQNYGTEEKRMMAMINHDIDVLCDVTPEAWDVLMAKDPYANAWLPGYPYGCFNDPCERGIQFNDAIDPFSSIDFRWAMCLAMDIEQVAMATFRGQMRVSPLQMPPVDALQETYHKPMRQWLTDFAFEDGYKPFNPNYAVEIAEILKGQGIEGLPESEEDLVTLFGVGWWKYDPEKATELFQKAGLEKKDDGKWYYNDKPFTFTINAPADFEVQSMRLAFACADAWRKFGLDVEVQKLEGSTFHGVPGTGDYEAGAYWPACGIIPDFHNKIEGWHKDYVVPNGEMAAGNSARWASDEISRLLDEMAQYNFDDPKIVEVGTEIMKQFVIEMPWIPMFGTSKIVPVDNYWWTNFVSSENNYEGPWWWWSCFKYQLPKITPVDPSVRS